MELEFLTSIFGLSTFVTSIIALFHFLWYPVLLKAKSLHAQNAYDIAAIASVIATISMIGFLALVYFNK